MAKRPKKKKAGNKTPKTGIVYTPFSMVRRVNDLSKLEGKGRAYLF